MRLLLIKDQFFFPTFMVVTGQFQRWESRVIEQVGRQTMGFAMAGPLWVIQRVLDHPHDDAVAVLVSIVRRGINLGQKRAIRQPLDRPQDQVAFETNQEFGAPRVQFFPMCVAEKAAIFQQQGVSRKVVPELIDQFLFAVVVAAHGHGNFDMRTQFHQADLADLREGAVATATAAPAKVRVVSRRVRHVQDSAVDAHQYADRDRRRPASAGWPAV